MNPCGCPTGATNASRCPACREKGPISINQGCLQAVVVDDANDVSYLYGNVQYEENHRPEEECLPFVAIPTKWENRTQMMFSTEVFQGEFPNNAIELKHCPNKKHPVLVFLNGLHQDEGQEYDYKLENKLISFTFHQLIPTDRVTVKYYYAKGE